MPAHVDPKKAGKVEIIPPAIANSLVEKNLCAAIAQAQNTTSDVESALFTDAEADGCTGVALEFSGCRFVRCSFSDWTYKRVSFVDCLFENCDLSGLRLENPTFQRVRLQNCRLTGTELLRSVFNNVVFVGCTADYFTIAEGKLNRVLFENCRLRESLWQDNKPKSMAFEDCDLTSAQIRIMPMNGFDMPLGVNPTDAAASPKPYSAGCIRQTLGAPPVAETRHQPMQPPLQRRIPVPKTFDEIHTQFQRFPNEWEIDIRCRSGYRHFFRIQQESPDFSIGFPLRDGFLPLEKARRVQTEPLPDRTGIRAGKANPKQKRGAIKACWL